MREGCTKYWQQYRQMILYAGRKPSLIYMLNTLLMKVTKKQSKKRSLNVIIPLVVYTFDVMLSIGQTNGELKKSLEKYRCDWSDLLELSPTSLGRTVMTDSNHTIIRFTKWPETCQQYGTLAHEIFHAVDFIFKRIGITLSEDSDEAYAYMIGYLTEEIYKKL